MGTVPGCSMMAGANAKSICSKHTEQSPSAQDDVCYFSARSYKTEIYPPVHYIRRDYSTL
jgi:hypothetical protein